MIVADSTVLRIGAWRVDPALDEISRDGASVKLEPRAMKVLLCLAEHAGQVVSVDQLLNAVWKDVVVTPDSVYQAVAGLRRALGDTSKKPAYIANVLRRGYRLVASVTAWNNDGTESNSDVRLAEATPVLVSVIPANSISRGWLLRVVVFMAAALVIGFPIVRHFWPSKQAAMTSPQEAPAVATIFDKSIAVLPFVDMSEKKDQEYFADGIAEEILNVLSHVKGLKVASRTSSFQFRKSDIGAPPIAQKLGVRYVLEGSVRKASDMVRITAQLIDSRTDHHEWSESFDRPLSTANLFAIQDEIAKSIVDHLAATIGTASDVTPPTARKADTASEAAYDLYLKGRSLFMARTKENLVEAARVLREAVAKDPNFARAWEMLGAVLVTSKSWDVGDESDTQAGADAADTALRLDPNLSLAHAVRGEFQLFTIPSRGAAGWEDSSESYSRAIAHDPTNATAYAWLGSNEATLGYLDRAVQNYQRCLDIDPAYELCRRKIAALYLYLGRTDEALRLYELGLENGYLVNDIPFAPALAVHGDRFGALSILAGVYRDHPQLILPLFRALTDPTFDGHDRQDAIALVGSARNSRTWAPNALWMLKAYDKIIAATDYPEPPIWWARDDAAWLNSHSRKQAMQHWHLPEYWRKHGFPPQCKPIGESDFECR